MDDKRLILFEQALEGVEDAPEMTCKMCEYCNSVDEHDRADCKGFPEMSFYIVPIRFAAGCAQFKEK